MPLGETVAAPDFFVYRVEHDRGLAPNPFFGICSLAVCKPQVRLAAKVGDIVLGTASYGRKKPLGRPAGGRAAYVMRVTAITDFQSYRRDFKRRWPVMNGSRIRAVGDAIYWQDADGWHQDNSLHSQSGGLCSYSDLKRDVLDADRILLSDDFTYWGDIAPALPAAIAHLGRPSIRYQRYFSADETTALLAWSAAELGRGRVGMPIDWLA